MRKQAPSVVFHLPLYPEGLAVLRQLAEDIGDYAALSKVRRHRIALALDELFVNIHEHGYLGQAGKVECEIHCLPQAGQAQHIAVEFRDYAPVLDDLTCCQGVNPESIKANPVPGGLGMHLIEKVTEKFELIPLADGNRWRLLFDIGQQNGVGEMGQKGE